MTAQSGTTLREDLFQEKKKEIVRGKKTKRKDKDVPKVGERLWNETI